MAMKIKKTAASKASPVVAAPAVPTPPAAPPVAAKAPDGFVKKVQKAIKSRERSTKLSAADSLVINSGLAKGWDAERVASEVISERDWSEAKPAADAGKPADAEAAAYVADVESLADADASAEKSAESLAHALKPLASGPITHPQDYTEVRGMVYIRLPMPVQLVKARVWAAFNAKVMGVDIELMNSATHEVVERFNGPELKWSKDATPVDPAAPRPRLVTSKAKPAADPNAPVRTRGTTSDFEKHFTTAVELAKRPEGVTRAELKPLEAHIPWASVPWMVVLGNRGKKAKMSLTSEAGASGKVYKLHPIATAAA